MRTKLGWLVLAFINVALPQGTAADETHFDHCPKIWSEYVELVRSILASVEAETPPVLFVGTGGAVHNCLGEQIKFDTLQAIQEHETSLLVVFDGDIDGPAKDWPLNVCTTATARLDFLTYLKVNLPYALPVLRSANCKNRVYGAINYEFEHFKELNQ